MIELKKILVPRDFSACGEEAVQEALDLARRVDAEVHLLFVEVLYADAYAPASLTASAHDTLRERLVEGVEGGLHIEHAIERDIAAAPAIVSYAEEHDIDLIMMGTHGRRGLRRLLLGSAAEEVVRTAPCPVCIVRCPESTEATEHRPAILVPIDFSQHSQMALRHAKALAPLFDARLDLLHVIEEQLHPAFYNTGVFSVYDMIPEIEEQAAEELETVFRETEGPDVEAAFYVRHGHAAHEIVAFAKEHRPTLIVMATHGLRGVEHFLMGSVAEKVVRMAPTPVFTVKAFGKSLMPTPALAEIPERSTP